MIVIACLKRLMDNKNIKVNKRRLDVFLFENGYFDSREKARIAIMEGKVFVNNQKEDKPGTMIKSDSEIVVKGEKLKYVSRGGYKLEKAINVFNIDLKDKTCADIGSSTGGFTDCMLQNGARRVYAIDCGTNQLDYKLRTDERVIVMENTNARYITNDDLKEKVNFVSVDVSFISLEKILGAIENILIEDGHAMMLIKPQFEAGKDLVEKNGVIKDKDVHKLVIENIISLCIKRGFKVIGLDFSPIKGPAGNIEYLIYVTKSDRAITLSENFVSEIVEKSHMELDK